MRHLPAIPDDSFQKLFDFKYQSWHYQYLYNVYMMRLDEAIKKNYIAGCDPVSSEPSRSRIITMDIQTGEIIK